MLVFPQLGNSAKPVDDQHVDIVMNFDDTPALGKDLLKWAQDNSLYTRSSNLRSDQWQPKQFGVWFFNCQNAQSLRFFSDPSLTKNRVGFEFVSQSKKEWIKLLEGSLGKKHKDIVLGTCVLSGKTKKEEQITECHLSPEDYNQTQFKERFPELLGFFKKK